MKSSYRSFFENIGLLVLSLTIALAVFEIGLRVLGYDALNRLKTGREMILRASINNDIKYELTPGAKGYAWHTDIEINANGHRGRKGVPGKFNGFRIVILGDSITFGNYLPLEATYAYQLDELLTGKDSKFQVLNFGVGGYDILQEVALLEHVGVTYEPNVVVVGFCLNDVGIVSANLEYIERVHKYQSNVIFRSRVAQYIVKLIDRIRMGSWMREKNRIEIFERDYRKKIAKIDADEHRLHELMRNVSDDFPSGWYKSEQRIGRLRYAFENLSELAKSKKFAVVVVIFPWLTGDQGNYPHETAHQIVVMEAQRAGFTVLDMLHDFMNAGMESLRISKRDLFHPNDIGHRIIAKKLAVYIQDELSD